MEESNQEMKKTQENYTGISQTTDIYQKPDETKLFSTRSIIFTFT